MNSFYMILNNGVTTTTTEALECTIPERPSIPVAEMGQEVVSIPGRDGELRRNVGYKDRIFPVSFHFKDGINLPKTSRKLVGAMMNCKSFQFSDDDEVEYRVCNVKFGDIERELRVLGRITAQFTIQPFNYYTNVNKIIMTGSKITINNPGTYYSRPLIKVYSSGTVLNQSITIDGTSISIKEMTDYLYIDSETRLVYKEGSNQNKQLVGRYPILPTGQFTIVASSGISSIEIEPRWRCF